MKWQKGRQNSNYEKLNIWTGKRSDCWILKFQPFTNIPPHKDPVQGRNHWRLNIVLKGDAEFTCGEVTFNLWNRIILFRPDLFTHSVSNGSKTRYVLSIGVTTKQK